MYSKFTKIFVNSHAFLRISSLIFAILLFVYVNGEKLQNVRNTDSSNSSALTSTQKKTITVPLDMNVDSDRYVVTGYPSSVKVTITGPAALVTTTINTQNFKVSVDLSGLSAGNHKVKLKATGINKDLNYTIDPGSINVQIATRKTKTMPVETKIDSDQLSNDYKVGKATVSTDSVKITGAIDEINKVDKIIAVYTIAKNTKTDISRKVTLQAVDSSGNTVNVVISPTTTTINIPISATSSNRNSSNDVDSTSDSESSASESASIDNDNTETSTTSSSEETTN